MLAHVAQSTIGTALDAENQTLTRHPRPHVRLAEVLDDLLYGDAPTGPFAQHGKAPHQPSPEEAADWTVRVLGDEVVRTVSAEPDETQPGVGLLNHHDAEARGVVELLQALVSGGSPPSLENLEAVTAPGTLITRQVIEGIQARPAAEQALFIGKLAGQVALERTVERALLARRMLLTGMRLRCLGHARAASAPALPRRA